jgi:hypothetical protein
MKIKVTDGTISYLFPGKRPGLSRGFLRKVFDLLDLVQVEKDDFRGGNGSVERSSAPSRECRGAGRRDQWQSRGDHDARIQ